MKKGVGKILFLLLLRIEGMTINIKAYYETCNPISMRRDDRKLKIYQILVIFELLMSKGKRMTFKKKKQN